jgi:hypothetical protein
VSHDFSRLRRRFESRMDDAVAITHNPFGLSESPMNPNTGKPTTDSTSAVYSGKALLKPVVRPELVTEGADVLELQYYECHLPISAPVPHVGDEVTVTACVRDPELVGRKWTVTDVPLATYAISRRFMLQQRESARPRAGR